MRRNNKMLYEKIMKNVAKIVKKHINEAMSHEVLSDIEDIIRKIGQLGDTETLESVLFNEDGMTLNNYIQSLLNKYDEYMEDVLSYAIYKNDDPYYAAEEIKYMAENNEQETGTEPYFALDFLNSLYSYLENELS